jgi:alpha-glucoside transport system substrate-binding protein
LKRRRSWLVLLAVALVIAATFAATASSKPAARSAGSIEVLSLWGGSEKDAFLKVTAAFKQKTGITVEYTTARDFVPVIRTRLAAGNPPDVAIIPRPGVLNDLAKQGAVKDLGPMGLTKSYITARYSPAWVKLGTVNGKIYGVAAKANSKSVMWYRPDEFKKYKRSTPKTWAQLLAVTKAL